MVWALAIIWGQLVNTWISPKVNCHAKYECFLEIKNTATYAKKNIFKM